MPRLHSLRLSHNPLTGTLPAFLGDLPLDHISVQETQLTGEVPSDFGKLTDLTDLHLQLTKLGGTMPEEVCNLIGDGKTMQTLQADCTSQMECSCCTKCY